MILVASSGIKKFYYLVQNTNHLRTKFHLFPFFFFPLFYHLYFLVHTFVHTFTNSLNSSVFLSHTEYPRNTQNMNPSNCFLLFDDLWCRKQFWEDWDYCKSIVSISIWKVKEAITHSSKEKLSNLVKSLERMVMTHLENILRERYVLNEFSRMYMVYLGLLMIKENKQRNIGIYRILDHGSQKTSNTPCNSRVQSGNVSWLW